MAPPFDQGRHRSLPFCSARLERYTILAITSVIIVSMRFWFLVMSRHWQPPELGLMVQGGAGRRHALASTKPSAL